MSTVQVQKRKTLTFEEICPMWAEKIKEGTVMERTTTPVLLDISNTMCCVVGEAHRFSRLYYNYYGTPRTPDTCDECTYYSRRFCATLAGMGAERYDIMLPDMLDIDIECLKNKFTAHFNEAHAK